jgi:hypothetical protein
MKWVLVSVGWFLLLLVGIAAVAVTMSVWPLSARDAADFQHECNKDPGTFRNAYGGQVVTIKGRVVVPMSSDVYPTVALDTNGADQFFVQFTSPGDGAKASKSARVTVRGVVGVDGAGAVWLDRADLLSADAP